MRRIQVIFGIIGSVALIAGLMMIVVTTVAAPVATDIPSTLPPEGAVYVGSYICFTCHDSEHRDWSETAHPILFQDMVNNPTAVIAAFSTGEDVRQVEIGGVTRAYTAADVTFAMGSEHHQRYIMQTDTGYIVLPGQWDTANAAWVEADQDNWLENCADCHTTGFERETQTWTVLIVGCETCHGPASVHIGTAQSLLVDETLSSEEMYTLGETIVATVDAAVCDQCHGFGSSGDTNLYGYPVGYMVSKPETEEISGSIMRTEQLDDANFCSEGAERSYPITYETNLQECNRERQQKR